MKNKPTQNDIKGQKKFLNISKPAGNVKNREQLRKKLKGLLDKQMLSPIEKVGQKISLKANSSHNTEQNRSFNQKTNLFQSKSSKQNDKEEKPKSNGVSKKGKGKNYQKKTKTNRVPSFNSKNDGPENISIKSNILTKNEETIMSNDCKSKDKKFSLKRKFNKKVEPLSKVIIKSGQLKEKVELKVKKTSENTSTSNDNLKPKKQKLVSRNHISKSKKQEKPPKKKTEKGEANKKKTQLSKNKAVLTKKSAKTEYTQGRGPLRPQTSESELDADLDASPCQLKRKSKQIISSESEIDIPKSIKTNGNKELALVRAKNDFEGFGSDNNNSLFDFLFDGTYNDSGKPCSDYSQNEHIDDESESEYSDEESDFESETESYDTEWSDDSERYANKEYSDDYSPDFSSADDDSYQPPEDFPEDVYIAKGTAVKYELTNDNIGFDSDTDAQIIEMPSKITEPEEPSVIKKRPSLPLNSNTNQKNKNTCENDQVSKLDSDDSCPELVPIEPANFYSSSSDSSHSCCGSCDCSCEETTLDTSIQYTPMTPEVIKAKAQFTDEMETFFDTMPNDSLRKMTSDSVLEEISSSCNNPLMFKVYTINNEVINNDSFLSESSTMNVEQMQKGVDGNIQKICFGSNKKITETPQKIITEPTHVNKKLKLTTDSSHNELPSPKSFGSTEESSPNNKKDKTNSTKSSQQKSPIRTLFFNAINSNHVIVLLKDSLYIYGTVKLKLLAGCLEIFGYNPKRNEVLEIFSPRGYSSLKIEPSHPGVIVPLNEKELFSLTQFFIRSDLEEIITKFDASTDAIVILERNDRSKKVNMLRKYMVEHLFPNMNSIQSDRPFYTSEFLLRCILTPNTDKALYINPDWNTIRVQNNSKIMIIGGKSVGKSTLMRYLINKNINKYQKILLVDLDIGQPEMFVPQTVSATTLTAPLLGPGYFFNKQPDKSFLVGHINIINCVNEYIDSLKALFEYCNGNDDYKDIPWIVNTMGYNKGFGDELISVICSLLHPSNIIQFESDREINDFDIIMMKDNIKSIEKNIVGDIFNYNNEFVPQHQLTLIKSLIPKERGYKNDWSMKPKDMRLAMILSRLSSTLIGHAEWMTDVKPLCASIDGLNIIKMGEDQIDKEDLVKTLVGNLVYLCRMESGKAHECFGIGVVRGVDYPLRQIYLLPTIPFDLLGSVNCLAICGIPLPSSILLNQGPKVKGVASYVYNTLDEAASMYIQQMYNKPQQSPWRKRK